MMKCETGEMGDGQKNVSTPVQDVGVRGGRGGVLVLLDSLAPHGVVSSPGYF